MNIKIEQMQLAALSHSSGFEALCVLMEQTVRDAVAELLATDPANQNEVLAKHNSARTMAAFYTRMRKAVEFSTNESLGDVRAAAIDERLKEMTKENFVQFVQ